MFRVRLKVMGRNGVIWESESIQEGTCEAIHSIPLSERREQLDYAGALAAGLPIGSGLIESGHRHVIQARPKKSGAWWKEANARGVVGVRLLRANGDWESYWQAFPHHLNN